jgi:hypothetical protein
MNLHDTPHPLAGQTVQLNDTAKDPAQHAVVPGASYRLEDWWDRVSGQSWMDCIGNPAASHYALRAGVSDLPADNNVVYGKIGPRGHLVHASELGES